MQIRNFIKRSLLVVLLSFTFFAKDCHFGCSTAPKPEDRLSYNTFSLGFPLPYFDLNIFGKESVAANGGMFQILFPYPIHLVIPINILFVIGIFLLFSRFEYKEEFKAKILSRSIFATVFFLDVFVFINYYPDFLVGIAYWVYIFPMLGVAYLLDSNTDNALLIAIASRIYFVFLIAMVYFICIKIMKYREGEK